MIAYISLVLSVGSLILWILFAISIRKIFNRLYPLFQSFGIVPDQNLKYSTTYAKMSTAAELPREETDKN